MTNPYYNEELSNTQFSNALDGAQNLGQGLWQNPQMWAANPYVAAAGLAVDVGVRPLQDLQENRNMMDQVEEGQLPQEQYDQQGNMVYNRQGHSQGLSEVEDDVEGYWDARKSDRSFGDYINPLNTIRNRAHGIRTAATSDLGRKIIPKGLNWMAKKYDNQMEVLDNKREALENANERMTNYNTNQTNQRNQRYQSGIDRERRFNNLNRLNVY